MHVILDIKSVDYYTSTALTAEMRLIRELF